MALKHFGLGERLRRSDLALIRKAIAQGWDVPDETKVAILRDVFDVMNDDTAGPRLWCAAVRTVLAMEAVNIRGEEFDHELRHCVDTCRRWLAANPQPESRRRPRRPR